MSRKGSRDHSIDEYDAPQSSKSRRSRRSHSSSQGEDYPLEYQDWEMVPQDYSTPSNQSRPRMPDGSYRGSDPSDPYRHYYTHPGQPPSPPVAQAPGSPIARAPYSPIARAPYPPLARAPSGPGIGTRYTPDFGALSSARGYGGLSSAPDFGALYAPVFGAQSTPIAPRPTSTFGQGLPLSYGPPFSFRLSESRHKTMIICHNCKQEIAKSYRGSYEPWDEDKHLHRDPSGYTNITFHDSQTGNEVARVYSGGGNSLCSWHMGGHEVA